MRLTEAIRERGFSPQDFRTTTLGKLAHDGHISRVEYEAGARWREIYWAYLQSIGAPEPYGNSGDSLNEFSDSRCEDLKQKYMTGVKVLESCGKRVLHAVNAVAVFDEPEELGDFEFTMKAAKIGLDALAREI